MKILLAGGSGLIGKALIKSMQDDGHQFWILTRNSPERKTKIDGVNYLLWNGINISGWGGIVEEMDAVINLAGESLSRWPWTTSQKERFLASRVNPGKALTEAIRKASNRPRAFIQASGINHYGLFGAIADEKTPPGDDFLARLTIDWEAATQEVESLGVRRCVIRQAIVLSPYGGLLSLMALPMRLWIGGPLGSGEQAVPWIHIDDVVGAIKFLLTNENTNGVFNLIAPEPATNSYFYKTLGKVLHRPYWFKTPGILLKMVLGEMSVLILNGRFASPARLVESSYSFQVSTLEKALRISLKKI